MSILTQNYNGVKVVKLFNDGINIDQKLPKWTNASKRLAELKKQEKNACNKLANEGGIQYYQMRQSAYDADTGTTMVTQSEPFVVYSTPDGYEVKEDKVNFDKVAAANLQELTMLIKDGELNNILSGYGGMHNVTSNSVWRDTPVGPVPMDSLVGQGGVKALFKRVSMAVTSFIDSTINKPEFDAVKFFTFVKLTTKESAENYRDRVSKYLQAIHNAKMMGQTALVEQLLSEMIANKYESLLFSTGKYYVIDEDKLVEFAEKTERGVDLCYVKNYTRPIPMDIINKVAEMNNLEVFDNYVVLYYDGTGKVKKETRREEAKRKDPILFGVIAGSRKLYYVADWIDEKCDLTLEKFVDTLGVDKETLLDGDGPEVEKKPEEKKEQKPKPKKKRYTKKPKKE